MINIDANVVLERKLRDFLHLGEKKIGWATADAMNNAAIDAAAHLKRVAPRYIDRPAPYTLRGISRFPFFVKPGALEQWVGFRKKPTDEAHYLAPIAAGGRRLQKPSERKLSRQGIRERFITPTGLAPVKLNRYGNATKAGITKALSGSGGGKFFVARLKGRKAAAVYARKGRRRITRVLSLLPQEPRYSQTFPVGEILQDRYLQRFPAALSLYLRRKL